MSENIRIEICRAKYTVVVFTHATLANAGISCCLAPVCLSVTSRCSAEMAKRRIMQTMPHDGPETLVSLCRISQQNCRWGRLNAGAVTASLQLLMRSIVNLIQSQVYHTECPPYLIAACSP